MTIWPRKWERTINTYKADKMQVNRSCWIWRLPQIKTPPIMHQLEVSCIKPLEASFIFLSTSEGEIWQSKNFLNTSGNWNNWIWLTIYKQDCYLFPSWWDGMTYGNNEQERSGYRCITSTGSQWMSTLKFSVILKKGSPLPPHPSYLTTHLQILLSSTATEGRNSACITETITTVRVPQEVTCWQLTWKIVAGRILQLQSGTRSH